MIEGLQQANISLDKGIVRTPSLGQEGELSECVNLIPHAGEIVRIKEPQPITEDVTGQYMYYTLVWRGAEGGGSLIYAALSGYEDLLHNCPLSITYLHSQDRVEQTETFVINAGSMVNEFRLDNLSALEDIVSIELGDKDFMLSLPDIGYVGLKAYRLFEFDSPRDITFPTEEEQARMPVELQPGELLLGTNRCAGKENLIVRNGNTLVYYRPGEGRHVIATLKGGDVRIVTIGQTLIVYQALYKKYYLWDKNTYKEQDLIGAVPNVEFTLGDVLKYKIKNKDVGDKKYKTTWGWRPPYEPEIAGWSHTPGKDGHINFYRQVGDTVEETEQAITELYASLIAHYVETRKKFKDQGMHCFPFYVRWGVKLYDDSIINLSPPMIVMPTSILRPSFGICGVPIGENGGETTKYAPYDIYTTPLLSPRYLYAAIDASKMKDVDPKLVKGIVVYATPEIEVADLEHFTYEGLRERGGGNWVPIQAPLEDGLGIIHTAINNTEDDKKEYYFNYILTIPAKEDVDASVFSSPVEFYELATIPLPELKKHNYKMFLSLSNGQILDQNFTEGIALSPYTYYNRPDSVYRDLVNAGYAPYQARKVVLSTLTSQNALASASIQQQNYDVVQARDTVAYNERLFYGGVAIKNTANISRKAFIVDSRTKELKMQNADNPAPGIYVKIGESYLTLDNAGPYLNGFKGEVPFLAVPFRNASAIGFKADTLETYEPLILQSDSLSDCAQWSNITSAWLREKNDLKELFLLAYQDALDEKWLSNDYATLPYEELKLNAVAYTKVASPWVIEKMVELACGEIYALTSATEALSEGQFGDFPIYAFTDNGIYALSIAQDGTIEAKQAVSRDVLLSTSSTLQIDKAVIYPTKEGLKLISGRNTSLLSKSVGGMNVDESEFDAPEELYIPDAMSFQQQLEGAVQEEELPMESPAVFSTRSTTTGGTLSIYAVCLPEGVEVTVRTDRPGIGKATILVGQETMDIAVGNTVLFDSGYLPLAGSLIYHYPDVLPTEQMILAGYFIQEDFVTETTGQWAIKKYIIDGGKVNRKEVTVNVTCNENGIEVSPYWSSAAIDVIKLRIGFAQYIEQSLTSGNIASWPASSVYIGKTGSGLIGYQHPNAVLAAYMVQVMYAALDGTIIPLETFLEKHKVQVNITVTEPTTPPEGGGDDGGDDGGGDDGGGDDGGDDGGNTTPPEGGDEGENEEEEPDITPHLPRTQLLYDYAHQSVHVFPLSSRLFVRDGIGYSVEDKDNRYTANITLKKPMLNRGFVVLEEQTGTSTRVLTVKDIVFGQVPPTDAGYTYLHHIVSLKKNETLTVKEWALPDETPWMYYTVSPLEEFRYEAVIGANKWVLDEPWKATEDCLIAFTKNYPVDWEVRTTAKKIFYTPYVRPTPEKIYRQKHYVYDIVSGQWATQILDRQLTTCVAGYPFSTMQFGTQLMQYTNEQEAEVIKQGWLLTRPVSFSDPFTRKMLADIRVLGQKTNTATKFKVQVYVSEDRVKWYRLTSLKGRSAKWYRFLIKADMCGLDTLTGITCQYVPRLGSKLR